MIFDPSKLGIKGNPRNTFYIELEKFSNVYTIACGINSSYSHKFELIFNNGLLWYYGFVTCYGVALLSNSAMNTRYMNSAACDETNFSSMLYSWWL